MMIQGCVVLGNHAAIKLRLHRPIRGWRGGIPSRSISSRLQTTSTQKSFVKEPTKTLWCYRSYETQLSPESRHELPLVHFGSEIQLNLSTTATLGTEESGKKVAVVERWPLWGGRGIIRHLFSGSTTCLLCQVHAYCSL